VVCAALRRFRRWRDASCFERLLRVGLGFCLTLPFAVQAQNIDEYFPPTVPGYQTGPAVTSESAQLQPYAPLGMHLGDFTVNADLDESTGYNSNVTGFTNAPGSWVVRTAPSLTVNSDWSRDQLGAVFNLVNSQYIMESNQNHSDWTATIGGGYTIGQHDLVLGYSHLSLHEAPTQIGSVLSSTPIPFQVDDVRANYTFDQGRFSFVPRINIQHFQFGDATLENTPFSQQDQNRVETTGELETRYALSDLRSLMLVIEGIDTQYTYTPAGQPSNSSTSFLTMAGIDYPSSGVWRYRLLAGVENRRFVASQYATHTAPIVEASVIWTPTGLTTVTGVLSRTIEDPASAGTGGYTDTRGSLIIDHEYLRNVLLQGRIGFESADYLVGGAQSNFTVGARARWLLNRNMHLSLDYSFLDQSSGPSSNNITNNVTPGSLTNNGFGQNLILLTLHFAL
jgi:hypothetical protein